MKIAIRSLLRTPAFTLMAIVALALGIGANSAIFTIFDSVLLRPLPFPEPQQLFHVARTWQTGSSITLSGHKYREWLDDLATVQSAVAYTRGGANIAVQGFPERVTRVYSTARLFDVYGVKPVIGRFFTPEDETASPVVVLSHGLWQRRFGGNTAVLGRSMLVEGAPAVVVGVAPAHFDLGWQADLFLPFHIAGGPNDSGHQYTTVVRLKAGVGVDQAREELRGRERTFRSRFGRSMAEGESIGLLRLAEVRTGNVWFALWLLLGAAGFVLLIACANVANLLLARSSARARELSIRAALGATRARIAGQLLTEGFLLSTVAAGLGLLIASWALQGLLAIVPDTLPRASEVSIDGRVIGAMLGLSIVTTLLFALAPALGASRPAIANALRESRGANTSPAGRRTRHVLVASEIGLCTVLLIGSALLIQSFLKLRSVDPGFDPTSVLTFKMSIPERDSADPSLREAVYNRLVDRIEAIPGVEAAAATTEFPLNGGPDLPVEVEGRLAEDSPIVHWQAITANLFQTVQMPLIQGRAYDRRDSARSEPVAIVNAAFLEAFKLDDPIGRQIRIGRALGPKWADVPRTIVGVVGDVKTYALHGPARPTVYLPVSQVRYITTPGSWLVRVRNNASDLPKLIQSEVQSVDPLLPAAQFRSMEDIIDRGVSQHRFNMLLLSLFGGLALSLALIGVYAVTSYTVTQRTQEIGIRMALGASVGRTLRMVIRESLLVGGTGILLGVAGSLALTRLLRALLYEVSARDPATFIATSVCLVGVTLLSTLIPAGRAASIDPMQALRYE
jgi:putative ABC transport system permease protein